MLLRHKGPGLVFILLKWHGVQTTQIDKQISSKRNMLTGVPQGSVLGPLLFLNYINYIRNSSGKLSFYSFADDTNLLYADIDLKLLEGVMKVSLWLVKSLEADHK